MSEQGTATCYHFHFGLIVTGKGEREHLPKLFASLATTGVCDFRVIRRIEQRGPIVSGKRKLEMVGSGKTIPDKDSTEIGFPARGYLTADGCNFVVLIDDLEHDRRGQAQQVFDRYRRALDTMLPTTGRKRRASVHFLANMLEAYYFADASAVNGVLNLALGDCPEDVETIRNPKADLKRLCPGFDEVEHGGEILARLDVERVLSRPDTCAWLRTLFAWCSKVLEQYPCYDESSWDLPGKYRLHDGKLSEVTRPQIDNL